MTYFNPRSHEGSDRTAYNRDTATNHFNPRSHEGSDQRHLERHQLWLISIRAPTRGATKAAGALAAFDDLFQSALPRGERLKYGKGIKVEAKFQSALPRGERRELFDECGIDPEFQSALPRGERRSLVATVIILMQFQSALPRGERHDRHPGKLTGTVNFNPRSHEGSDVVSESTVITVSGFQSALPRGERRLDRTQGIRKHLISIRAPTRGATLRLLHSHHHRAISIRAPTRGATLNGGSIDNPDFISIRAPTRGATVANMTGRSLDGNFNPRSHEGSDIIFLLL